jgi:RNA polymerase sigma factor (sigma-70 family)
MEDRQLLRQYADHGSEEAFAALVNRHLSLVYSAALRRLGDRQGAEEVTQSVFVLLARKAREIQTDRALAGWLYRTSCYAAARRWRADSRRRRRETNAASMNIDDSGDNAMWEQLVPQLDSAMDEIGQQDREAVLLRFFQRKPLQEVGRALGISEDAARMRVNRALDKLRTLLVQKGVACSSAALGGLLLHHAVEAVPISTATAVQRAAAEAVQAGSVPTLLTAISSFIAETKLKTAALIGLALVVAITSAFSLYNHSHERHLALSAQSPPLAIHAEAPTTGAPAGPRQVVSLAQTQTEDSAPGDALASLRRILYSPISEGNYPSPELRAALNQLKSNSNATVALLLEALEEREVQKTLHYLPRARAISGLAHLGELAQEALPALMRLIRTPGAPHRDMAIWHALPKIRPEAALAYDLMEFYRTDVILFQPAAGSGRGQAVVREVWMRDRVRHAIGSLVMSNRNLAPEVGRLIEPYLNDPDADVRLLAASALAFVPDVATSTAVGELISVLRQKQLNPGDPFRNMLVVQALRDYRTLAEPAVPALKEFIRTTSDQAMQKAALDALSAITPAPAPAQVHGETLAKEVKFGSRSVMDLGLALRDTKTRVQAARALASLGPKAGEALPHLHEALKSDDDVFRDLLVLAIKKIAPDAPKPLLSQSELATAMRAVAEHVAATVDGAAERNLARQINSDLHGSLFFEHSQVIALADKLGATDSKLQEIFVAKLLEIDPKLQSVLKRR